MCGRKRVIKSTSIRARCKPGEYEMFGQVNREELMVALKHQRQKRELVMKGVTNHVTENVGPKAEALLRQVKVSQASMWGSSQERLRYRRKAFSMDAHYKSGAVFVTITPSETGTLMISAITGRVCPESISRAEQSKFPDHAERAFISSRDPCACSQYFETVCEIFFQEIVGFNTSNSLPYRGGEIFGVVNAYLGVVEAQKSGTLHLHTIIFIAGLPRTVGAFCERLEQDDIQNCFAKNLCMYADSVVKSYLNVSCSEGESLRYSSCDSYGSIQTNKKVPEAAFRLHRSRKAPYPTSQCRNCTHTFGACEVLRSQVERLHDSLNNIRNASYRRIPLGSTYQETDRMTEEHMTTMNNHEWPPTGESQFSELGMLHRLFLSRIVLLTQQHNHRYVESCFKNSSASKRGLCRYGFPRQAVSNTHLTDEHTLQLRRDEHNEYINCYNDVLALLFQTNHDIRFLLGGTTDAFYYVMKYVTKCVNPEHNVERALLASYERRRRSELNKKTPGIEANHCRTGRSRVNSMAIALSRMQEVPATLCALYLRRKSALYTSHRFATLMLAQCIAIVREEEHDGDLVETIEGTYVRAPGFFDYWCRPVALRHFPMIEFVSQFERVRLPSLSKPGRASHVTTTELLLFSQSHPLHKTHCLKKRSVPVIPDIIGPRLPNINGVCTANEKELFATISLILFFPFDSNVPVKQNLSTFWASWVAFRDSGDLSQRSADILENMLEYYVSKETGKAALETLREARFLYTEQDTGEAGNENENDHFEYETLPPDDVYDIYEDEPDDSTLDRLSSYERALNGFESEKGWQTTLTIEKTTAKASVEAAGQSCMKLTGSDHADGRGMLSTRTIAAAEVMSEPKESGFQDLIAENRVGDIYKDMIEERDKVANTSRNANNVTQNTTISRLRDVLRETAHHIAVNVARDEGITDGKPFDSSTHDTQHISVIDTIKLFKLNKLQSWGFALAANALLEKLHTAYHAVDLSHSAKANVSVFIGGPGGTGKTRIIEALSHFCNSWGVSNSLRTCAPTGIAAGLIGGQTVHSLLGLCAGTSLSSGRRIPKKLIDANRGILMLIVDEISMLGRKILGSLDIFCRQVKENDIPFGGIVVVFCGDFFQIPPVAGDPIFYDPKRSTRKTNILDDLGFQAWKSLDHVIMLEESVRHMEDHEFNDCLTRLRIGKATENDRKYINARVIGHNMQEELNQIQCSDIPLVVRNNDLRMALNWRSVGSYSQETQSKPIVCVAEMTSKRGKHLLSHDLEMLFSASDTDMGNMASLLPLITGMPVRITQNISVELGIANGTDGVLAGMDFSPSNTFRDAKFFNVDCILSKELPTIVYVHSNLFKKTLTARFPDLPDRFSDDTVPLQPIVKEEVSIRLARKLLTKDKLRIRQYPIIPAFSSTTYKVQGKTFGALVSFPLTKGCRMPPPRASLYVVLSRVRRLSALFLIEAVTKKDIEYFKPCEELLDENTRLLELHRDTIHKLATSWSELTSIASHNHTRG